MEIDSPYTTFDPGIPAYSVLSTQFLLSLFHPAA
jgi:hypothetical protein